MRLGTALAAKAASFAPLAALLAVATIAASASGAEPAGQGSSSASGPRTSSLSWVRMPGAEGCVPTQLLARSVEERLGRSVFVSAAQADVSVEGRVSPKKGGGFQAILTLRDANGTLLGTREINRNETSCDAMKEPLALVIAVMIDPDAALAKHDHVDAAPSSAASAGPSDAGANTSTPPTANTENDAGPPDAAPAPVMPPPKPDQPWLFEGSAGFAWIAGLMPRAGLGVYGNALLTPPKFVTLEGFGAIFLDDTVSAEHGAYTTFDLGYLGSGLCPAALIGRVAHLFGCIESHLGVLRNRQTGFVSGPGDDFRIIVDSAAEIRVTLRVAGPFALRLGLAGVVPWVRYAYTYQRADGSTGEIFKVSPVGAVGDIGIGLAVP